MIDNKTRLTTDSAASEDNFYPSMFDRKTLIKTSHFVQFKPESSNKKKLGTIFGVYFPCIQNILGIILFIRLGWIVGNAGILEGFFIVLIPCCTTLLTAFSMSAIATNGVVASGGSYFMISRALGPEFGGAVGILFYLGTSVASAMYIIGAVEISVEYLAPSMVLSGNDYYSKSNSFRLYGVVLLMIMFVWVLLGVKFVSFFSPIALVCVLFSILSLYAGYFTLPRRPENICYLSNHLIAAIKYNDGKGNCSNTTFYEAFCSPSTSSKNCIDYMTNHMNNITEVESYPGFKNNQFMNNFYSHYGRPNESISNRRIPGKKLLKHEIVSEEETSFVILLSIFFPSCTGIMAGSNRSGDLKSPQKSIPLGTIAAILTTSFVYLTQVLLFGVTVEGDVLRDKTGVSFGESLVAAQVGFPHPLVILLGALFSTIGAGLQSLTGAPRLLQAIADDNVIPAIRVFRKKTKHGEPLIALLATSFLSLLGILAAQLDVIAPVITIFFLMCYGFVNLACVVQTLVKSPNWRPRFRLYHWSLSLCGVLLCVVLMFISSWYYALATMALAAGLYKYIEYKGAEQEWGDGLTGLAISAARYALSRLEEGPPHVKNWRPQLLIMCKLDENLQVKHPHLLSFSTHLKAGHGLTLVSTVLVGDIERDHGRKSRAKQAIRDAMTANKTQGFAEVVMVPSLSMGISSCIQSSGIASMRANTVLLCWPKNWLDSYTMQDCHTFTKALRENVVHGMATMILKGKDWDANRKEDFHGSIDIWWIVNDGGLLLIIPFLLKKHRRWRHCQLRIFAIAQMQDNSIQLKVELKKYLYDLRISAEVHVVELRDEELEVYVTERTLRIEERAQMLKEFGLSRRQQQAEPQTVMDKAARFSDKADKDVVASEGKVDKEIRTSEPKVDDFDCKGQQLSEEKVDETLIKGNNSALSMKKNNECDGSNACLEEMKHESKNQCLAAKDLETKKTKARLSDDNLPMYLPKFGSVADLSSLSNANGKTSRESLQIMKTALHLNNHFVAHSRKASLVILNMPGPSNDPMLAKRYMEYLEILTDNLNRVILVHGNGKEVVTIYS